MELDHRFVIIGAGIAGLNAAVTLRTEGYQGELVLIDQNADLPYDRPPLSKQYLLGQFNDNDILLRPQSYYKDNNIKLILGKSVKEIDTVHQRIKLDNGEYINWDKLLIAIGSKLKRLQIPGSDLENIYYLKTKEDACRLRNALKNINDIVIIGAGFIGSEVAATCRQLGINVTMIEALPIPLGKVLGDDIGQFIADLHISKGVKLITNEFAVEFNGSQRVEEVVTNTGRKISCQAVVIGIGVEVDLELVKGTKIKIEQGKGIHVDEYCETSVPGIFAAGDCALWPYRGEKIRVEHWDHALNQAKVAAKNMIKPKSEVYNTVPYFWSDQYDIKIQYLGHATSWETTVFRGGIEEKSFTVFYIKDNQIVGALFVNDPKNVLLTRRFMMQNTRFSDVEVLSDMTQDLKNILIDKK